MIIEDLITIVIPIREIDHLTQICLKEIRRHYLKVPVILVADHPSGTKMSGVQEILSDTPNLSDKRNKGVALARTEYIAFIDSDAYPAEGWLEAALSFLFKNPNAGVIGGPNQQHNLCEQKQAIPYLASQSFFISREPRIDSRSKRIDTIASSNMIFAKSTFEEVGGLNNSLYTGEDIEFCYRVSKKFTNYFVTNCIVHHKQRNLLGFIKQRFVWGRGIFNVLSKTFPKYCISLLPIFLVLSLILTAYLSLVIFIYFFLFYILVCSLDAIRITKNISKSFKVFPYIFLSQPLMGIGAISSLIIGDINNNYKLYDNNE